MIVLGLTGGIASGKSTVSKMLKEQGFPIIDADIISREIMKKGESAYEEIIDKFGYEILNFTGEIDRKRLREIVFNQKDKLKMLNDITHPQILNRIKEEIKFYKNNGARICVVDAALLIETGFYKHVDLVLLVYCDRETQINRLMNRDGLTYEQAIKIINSQMDFEEKKKFADYIIDNSKDLENTKKQLNYIINSIINMEEMNE
ncbi:MAG: dephospho-CoA kinase [Caloramator sp.]|nr:dephospho-CoA kinase [Caloramator sp.]